MADFSITAPAKVTTAPMNGSYIQRVITVTITLGTGTFGTTGFNTAKLPPLRTLATILKSGYPAMDRAEIRIYGVEPSVMNQVSTLGVPMTMERAHNTVTVEAGDAVNGMTVVYTGQIQNAWQDLDGAPETLLRILGWGASFNAVAPVPPISFPGTADVATMLAGIANRMGWAFENNGVQVQLASPYFAGSAVEQAHAIARAANIELYFDTGGSPGSQPTPGSGTLAIWPKSGKRGGLIPVISPKSGMIGYPRFQSNGMAVRTVFNPNLRLGGAINVQSTAGNPKPITQGSEPNPVVLAGSASGLWYITGPLTYDLAAQMPNGPWFCDINCARLPGPPST